MMVRALCRRLVPVVLATMGLAACGSDTTDATPAVASTAPAGAATATRSPAAQAELDGLRALAAAPLASFVGPVDGSDAYVAIVTSPSGTTAYVCDSAALGLWFSSNAATGAASIEAGHPSGAALSATIEGGSAHGTVVLGGVSHGFTARAAAFPAGLWEGFEPPPAGEAVALARYGWIVLGDGTQRGAKVKATATSPAGELDTATGAGSDGTAATPSAPPPPVAANDELLATCKGLREVNDTLVTAMFPPSGQTLDETQKARYTRAFALNVRNYTAKGCEKLLGPL